MKDIDFSTISTQIKNTRISKGYTQEYLANAADINTSHICNIENGRAKISLPTLVHVADALDVSVDYLLVDERINSDAAYEQLIIKKLDSCNLTQKKKILRLIEFVISDTFGI
ncbi:MAG: helix-turn-helix transcriptional regulator [Hespellia sp.]|nr:helix-turn-helix transcriptional regulator [Hespellia sp.]